MIGLALKAAGAWLKGLPRGVWIALAFALVLLLVWRWHVGEVRAADRAGFDRGVERTQKAYRKALVDARQIAIKRRAKQEAEQRRINEDLKNERDRALARIRGAAVRLLDAGPGAAACPRLVDHPGVPGGSTAVRGGAGGSPPVAGLPSGEGQQLAGLPWAGTVALAGNHDALRAYYLADREWHRRQSEAWEKWRVAQGVAR